MTQSRGGDIHTEIEQRGTESDHSGDVPATLDKLLTAALGVELS